MDWGRTLGAVEPWLAALVVREPPVGAGMAHMCGMGMGKWGSRGQGTYPPTVMVIMRKNAAEK